MKSIYTDQEVASASLHGLVDLLESRGISIGGPGLPDLAEMLEPGHRISWSRLGRIKLMEGMPALALRTI